MTNGLDDIHNIIAQDRARLRTNSNSGKHSPTQQTASPAMNNDKSKSGMPSNTNSASSPRSPPTPAKTRLTNEQKKKNHIESEKKRRDAIRAGFDRLADVVPNMQGQGRSEAVVLQHTVAYMKAMIAKRVALDREACAKGWTPEQAVDVYRKAELEVRTREDAEIDAVNAAVLSRNKK